MVWISAASSLTPRTPRRFPMPCSAPARSRSASRMRGRHRARNPAIRRARQPRPRRCGELSRVVALFEPASDLDERIAAADRDAGIAEPPEIELDEVAEQDWVRLTQSQFDPIRITDRLWIVPSWHVAPDPAAINLELDPGLAFGTGSPPDHPSVPGMALRSQVRGGDSGARLRLRLGHPRHRRRQAGRRRRARRGHRRAGASTAAADNAARNGVALRLAPLEAGT